MKPSTLRYIRTEQDVWSLLWRLMPRACKDLLRNKPRKINVQSSNQTRFNVSIKIN